MSPLEKRRRRVHKTAVHTVKLQKWAMHYLLFQKRRLHAKSCSKRPPACTVRLIAGKKASRSHGKANNLLVTPRLHAGAKYKTWLLAALLLNECWGGRGSNSPGRSDWLTAQTAKYYVSAGNMIASW